MKISNFAILGHSSRLHDFIIYTYESMPSPVAPPTLTNPDVNHCYTYPSALRSAQLLSLFCNRLMSGRYVVVQLPYANACLTLCEVEVYCMSLCHNKISYYSNIKDINNQIS